MKSVINDFTVPVFRLHVCVCGNLVGNHLPVRLECGIQNRICNIVESIMIDFAFLDFRLGRCKNGCF